MQASEAMEWLKVLQCLGLGNKQICCLIFIAIIIALIIVIKKPEECFFFKTINFLKIKYTFRNEKFLNSHLGSIESYVKKSKTIRTGDYVKDNLLQDIVEIFYVVAKSNLETFTKEFKENKLMDEDIVKNCILNIISDYRISLRTKLPDEVSSLLINFLTSHEQILLIQTRFLLQTLRNNTLKSYKFSLVNLCGFIISLIESIITNFKEMNGNLNCVEYHGKMIGFYDSDMKLKIKDYPIPHNIKLEFVKSVLSKIKEKYNADLVSLVDFYEFDKQEDETFEAKIHCVMNSKMAIAYSSYEESRTIIDIDTNKFLTETEIINLLDNTIVISRREELNTWSSLRAYMADINIKEILLQPILLKKDFIIGILVIGWFDKKNLELTDAEKKALQEFARVSSKFLRFQSN